MHKRKLVVFVDIPAEYWKYSVMGGVMALV